MSDQKMFRLYVAYLQKETDDYISIFLKKPEGFTFHPGSCFDLSFTEKNFHEGRIFSFSSSPTEELLRITFKKGITEYKKRLKNVKKGDTLDIYFYGIQYEFFIDQPMVFYAGGIGISVFRSIIKQIIDKKVKVLIKLIYCSNSQFPFKKELDEWGEILQMPIFYLNTKKDGRLDREKLGRFIDLSKMQYEHYIIGPPSMVDDTRELLRSFRIDQKTVHTDSFDGYNEESE